MNVIADDGFEPNDTPFEASPLTEASPINGTASNVDWYLINVDSNRIDIYLNFLHEFGDLDLYLYNDPNGSPISVSDSESDNELISADSQGDGFYYIQVVSYSTYLNTHYVLLWNDGSDDIYEPNNDIFNASMLPEEVVADGISLNEDWYQITTIERVIELGMSAFNISASFTFSLYDRSGNLLASEIAGDFSSGEVINYVSDYSGAYYVKVVSNTGFQGMPYSLWWRDGPCADYNLNSNECSDSGSGLFNVYLLLGLALIGLLRYFFNNIRSKQTEKKFY